MAEFSEAMRGYSQTFHVNDAPAFFPAIFAAKKQLIETRSHKKQGSCPD